MFIALKLSFAKDHFIKLITNYKKEDQNSCCDIKYSPNIETQHCILPLSRKIINNFDCETTSTFLKV